MHLHLHLHQLPRRPLRPSTLLTTLTTNRLTSPTIPTLHSPTHSRSFSSHPPQLKQLPLPPRPTLPAQDLKSSYLKGSGPGGQKINKTSSAVQLTHLPTGLVVKSQATRSQKQNFNIAKRLLAEKVEFIEKGGEGGESRVAKRGEWLREKKGRSGKKKRRKYRKLEEERVRGLGGEGGLEEEGEGGLEGRNEEEEGKGLMEEGKEDSGGRKKDD